MAILAQVWLKLWQARSPCARSVPSMELLPESAAQATRRRKELRLDERLRRIEASLAECMSSFQGMQTVVDRKMENVLLVLQRHSHRCECLERVLDDAFKAFFVSAASTSLPSDSASEAVSLQDPALQLDETTLGASEFAQRHLADPALCRTLVPQPPCCMHEPPGLVLAEVKDVHGVCGQFDLSNDTGGEAPPADDGLDRADVDRDLDRTSYSDCEVSSGPSQCDDLPQPELRVADGMKESPYEQLRALLVANMDLRSRIYEPETPDAETAVFAVLTMRAEEWTGSHREWIRDCALSGFLCECVDKWFGNEFDVSAICLSIVHSCK